MRIHSSVVSRTDHPTASLDCDPYNQHNVQTSGHLGIAKTTNSVSRYFYWPNMTKDIKDYVRSCMPCQLNKPANKSYGAHQPLTTPPGRWHIVRMDFAGPFVRSGEGQWDMARSS
jgi:putative transposase